MIRFDRNALICAKIGFDYSILGPWVSRRTEDIVYDKISELIDDNDISFDSSKYYDFLKRWPYTIIEVIKKSTIEEYKKIIKDKDDHTIPGVASIENAIQYVDDSEFINLLEGKIRVEIEESEYKESALYDKYVNHQSSFEFSLPKIQNVYANTIGGALFGSVKANLYNSIASIPEVLRQRKQDARENSFYDMQKLLMMELYLKQIQ